MSEPENLRLKISKTTSGTYYIPSLSIKKLKELSKQHKRRWSLSGDGKTIILKGE